MVEQNAPDREPFASVYAREGERVAEAKARHATMLARTDDEGRPLYRVTTGGNIVRTRPIKAGPRARILKRDGFACVECGAQEDLQIAHIEDYSVNGNNADENLRTLCAPCHVAESQWKATVERHHEAEGYVGYVGAMGQLVGDSIGWFA